MKKVITAILTFLVCVLPLAGCGPSGQNNSNSSIASGAATSLPHSEEQRPEPDDGGNIAGQWCCTLQEADYAPEISGYLRLNEDGSLDFEYGDGYGPGGMGMVMYRGSWHIDPDAGPSNLPEAVIFTLSLDSAAFAYDEENFPPEISGIYSYIIEDGSLHLTFVDGDPLYHSDGYTLWSYDFEPDYTLLQPYNPWRMSDSELTAFMNELLLETYQISDANAFYPVELNKWEDYTLWFGFVYEDGDTYRYAWLNAMTGEVELTDEVEDYTGEG